MNINKFNNNTRQQSLLLFSDDDLSLYFNKLNKLASKNPKYKDMYENDMNFVMSNSEVKTNNEILEEFKNVQHGGMSLFSDWFSKKDKRPLLEDVLTAQVASCKPGTFCNIITQPTLNKTSCEDRKENLDVILNQLKNEEQNPNVNPNVWKLKLYEFIEFLLCCNEIYKEPYYEYMRKAYIVPIVQIILRNYKFASHAMHHIGTIISNESKLYIAEYNALEKKKDKEKASNGKESEKFKQLKEQQDILLEKYGFGIIYLNKLIHKIEKKYGKNICYSLAFYV